MRTQMLPALLLTLIGCGDKNNSSGDDSGAVQDRDGDGFGLDVDCDDQDPEVNPDASEICDELDNNCDGDVDGGTGLTIYLDGDGDGFGKAGSDATDCEIPEGYAADGGDCDDRDAEVYPGAEEYCNGLDDDCDSLADNSAVDAYTFYTDSDGDGFGADASMAAGCAVPSGRVTDGGDCDDANAIMYPTAPELCNGQDDDCDASTLEAGTVTFREGTRYTSLTDIFNSGTVTFPAQYYMERPGELTFCGGSWKGALWIDADVSIVGVGGSAVNSLDAAEEFHSIMIGENARNVSIEGVKFLRGNANTRGLNGGERSGAGLFCDSGARLNLNDVVLAEGNAAAGGGAYISDCDVTFTDSEITGNVGVYGGGVAMDMGTLRLINSSINNNSSANYGGGLYLYSNVGKITFTMTDSFVEDNKSNYGSGMYFYPYSSYALEASCTATGKGTGGFLRNQDTYTYYGAVYMYMHSTSTTSTSNFRSTGCDFGTEGSSDDNSPQDIYHTSYGSYNYESSGTFTCTRSNGCR